MATKREIKKAFKAAVDETIAFLNHKGSMAKMQRLAERYERLSGLSRQAADNEIIAEAERRRRG